MLSKFLGASKILINGSRLVCVPKYLYSTETIKSDVAIPLNQSNENGKSENKTFREKWTGKNSYKAGIVFLCGSLVFSLGYCIAIYGPPELEDGTYKEDKFSSMNPLLAYLCRTFCHIREFQQNIKDPISDKLLPDPHPLYQPMTLVIEVNGILLHPEWTYKSGWKFKKRPGLELFLEAVSPFFEVVVFTNDSAMNLHPVLHQIDPNFQMLHYRLYREATRYKNGVHIKDLSTLNRDPKKVIRVDWDKHACSLQPRNTFVMRKWKGDMNDRELVDLAAFLRMMATNNLPDVRDGLDYYAAVDDPLREFRQRCEYLKEHMKEVQDTNLKKKKFGFNNLMNKLIK